MSDQDQEEDITPMAPDPDTEPGFGLIAEADEENNVSLKSEAYEVLARKYRPRIFDDMIGQEAMVQTLRNAFETGRIAHAFMLTGVRGVGKTTTARILARALNYQTAEADAPNVDMPEPGFHCLDIMAGSHVDVIEMDAASATGIDDIREIIENVRYRPSAARYKVFIIDEVHMLSTQAFNGLLKTLEEPPAHVKFVFATTEIRKVPVTVLSRCQRFDLRRLTIEETLQLLNKVCAAEGSAFQEESLALIARAAEGSARDALSLLDRALAHGSEGESDNGPDADAMRQMLGLADRGRVFDLFDLVMQGKLPEALGEFEMQYNLGADPIVILADLAELTYRLTRMKFVPSAMDDITMAEALRHRSKETADALSTQVLSRCWQVLLKGHKESMTAPDPMAAAEMVLIRLAHMSDLPAPEELLKQIQKSTPSKSEAQSPKITPSTNAPTSESARAPQNNVETTGMSGGQASHQTSHQASGGPVTERLVQNEPQAETQINPAQSPHIHEAPQIMPRPDTFKKLVSLVGQMREIKLKTVLETGVHLVRFEPASEQKAGVIEYRLAEGAEDISRPLSRSLKEWTGLQWVVSLSQNAGAETLYKEAHDDASRRKDNASDDPLVKAALEAFPGAEIVSVTNMDELSGSLSENLESDHDGQEFPEDEDET
ncbi:MAG TPA: DNA polymerase III subunit gamma/tau [Rhodobiaceae bacterium]|nr:DNA polymerase III subunit gamma/tau [Rhodobiaceae bacterium]